MVETNNQKNTDYGKVSVIMPNFNGEKFLRESIDSVLSQSYQNLELLFVDDCSTDGSLDAVKSFSDDRIRIFSTEVNGGAAKSRNLAIENATGKWIAFLDSDDIWLSEKLEKQLSFMTEKGAGFSFTQYDVVDENGEKKATFTPKAWEYSFDDILKHNYIGCLTAIYDAEKLGKVYMPENAEKREDVACWFNILKTGTNAYCLGEILAKYKLHANSVSANKFKMIKYQWRLYRKFLKFNPFKSLFYLIGWAVRGLRKYK